MWTRLDGSFALAVFRLRRSKAASLDLADASGLVHALRTHRNRLRRLHELLQIQSSFDRSCGTLPGEPEVALTTIRPFERLRFNSPPEPGHAPCCSSTRRSATRTTLLTIPGSFGVALGFVESRSGLRGLAERLVLPSTVRRRSWGSTLRRFAPASGGIASLHSRAHVPFAPLARPD